MYFMYKKVEGLVTQDGPDDVAAGVLIITN